jgi:DNA-binding winged helix-turn-helix (wHTH) protein/tetratricopeptide (TPR) repeat protein
MMSPPLTDRYRFGPFQVNAGAGELLKDGQRIKLQEQPFRLLVVLLEHAGEMVTRAELRSRIWQEDTFVDFDSSLRVAVRKLREALNDDADNPRYVETIPKRGYRFLIVDVHGDARNGTPHLAASTSASTEANALLAVESTRPKPDTGPAPRKTLTWIAASLAFVAAAIAAATLPHFRHRGELTAQDTVVLADFANSTGDPVFDGTLRQGMAIQLEQSPFLSLISEERIQQTLSMMGQPANVQLTPAIAQEICERTASAAVLDGSIASLGSHYVLGLRARECRTGKVLAEEQTQAATKESVLNALDEMASRFRRRIGESLATVARHNAPLAEASTSSLDALKAYSTGLKVAPTEGEAAALPFFKRAVEIDPQFAAAYAALGVMYGATGESALAALNASKAYALRDRVSDKDKFFIAAYYDGRVTGNQEKAQQTCEAWVRTYPREVMPYLFLAGFIYPASGKYEEALEEANKVIEIDPDNDLAYYERATYEVALNRRADAENTLRSAADRKMASPWLLLLHYDVAFLQNDKPEMDKAVALAQRTSGAEDWIADHQAFVLAHSGQLRASRRMSQHAVNLAQQATHQERAALFETGAALWEAMFGNAAEARKDATIALALGRNREVEYGVAFALALSGDTPRSQELADDLEKQFPEDTAVRFSYLPSIRALLALNRKERAKAIGLLQIAVPYELGAPRSSLQGNFGSLYPIYVRGEVYLAAHQGAEAAMEFQKIVDHPGIVLIDPIGALAHLQLGRAYALAGDTTKAKVAYQDFLSLWKDADVDIPIFKQAKMEFAQLQ